MSEFVIEKGIEIPKAKKPQRISRYPFADMEVGDSFEVPVALAKKVGRCAYGYGYKYNKRFSMRTVSPTVCRCWRVE